MLSVITVCIAAFVAGFTDAIVGGGGLIQTPVMLITFPQAPVADLLGTVKIPSFCGTAVSAWQYHKKVVIRWKLIAWIALAAFIAAVGGSYLVTVIQNAVLKPVILIVLVIVAVFTYSRKNLGHVHDEIPFGQALWKGMVAGSVIGFYDGFVGPGTGSFLVMVFIAVLGHDFTHASAHAKMINLATNLASILYFGSTGHMMLKLALPMALCNMAGGWVGTRMALARGNRFIRAFFLVVVTGTMLRFAWDIFFR